MAIKEGKKIIKYNNGDKYIGFLKNGNWKNNLREGEGKICILKDIIKGYGKIMNLMERLKFSTKNI